MADNPACTDPAPIPEFTKPPPHLVGQFQHRFEAEATATLVEQVLERGTEEIKNHHVTVAMRAVVVHLYVEDGE